MQITLRKAIYILWFIYTIIYSIFFHGFIDGILWAIVSLLVICLDVKGCFVGINRYLQKELQEDLKKTKDQMEYLDLTNGDLQFLDGYATALETTINKIKSRMEA